MICGLEIGMLVLGIITLVQGKFTLGKAKTVRGGPAYAIGVIMLMPFPLALAAGFFNAYLEFKNGPGRFRFDDEPGYLLVFEIVVTVSCLVLALGLAAALGRKPDKPYYLDDWEEQRTYIKRQPPRYEDEYDDFEDDYPPPPPPPPPRGPEEGYRPQK